MTVAASEVGSRRSDAVAVERPRFARAATHFESKEMRSRARALGLQRVETRQSPGAAGVIRAACVAWSVALAGKMAKPKNYSQLVADYKRAVREARYAASDPTATERRKQSRERALIIARERLASALRNTRTTL